MVLTLVGSKGIIGFEGLKYPALCCYSSEVLNQRENRIRRIISELNYWDYGGFLDVP